MTRDQLNLTGLWRFQPDVLDCGEQHRYHTDDLDTRLWREVRIPCTFDECASPLGAYEGAAWFRRTVQIPDAWRGRRIVLRFEGVNYHAKVWVNGTLAGEHADGFLRFDLPIHHLLRFDAPNTIAVRADNHRRQGEVPGMERGWRPFGGVLRDVTLFATDLLRIDSTRISATPDGKLSLTAQITNDRDASANVELSVQVTNAQGRLMASLSAQSTHIAPGATRAITLQGSVPNPQPWSPDHPTLYTACLTLRDLVGSASADPTTTTDAIDLRFGFRHVEVKDGKLLLNGHPIFLTGFNRHEDSAHTGPCTDLATVRADLLDMKQLGCNFVRLCHYPHHPAEVDLCDEIGLLVMGEIPLYWWNGKVEGEENCARKLDAAQRQLAAMIHRDHNHPSIIFWSVSNETHEQQPEVAAGNRTLLRLAKQLDPTRLAIHVSDHWREHPNFDADDVICLNAYPSYWSSGRNPNHDPATGAAIWKEGLAQIHARHPDKPILITEFGYPALDGILDNLLGEDLQSRVIEHEFRAFTSTPYVCGGTIWCYADHPWPEERFINLMTTSPFGVVTRDRRRKLAHATVRSLYQTHERLLPSPATPGEGGVRVPPRSPDAYERPSAPDPLPSDLDLPVTMLRPHLRDIPQVPFPPGFSIRPMRLDEIGVWTDIQRDAERIIRIADGLFLHQYGDDLPATQWRCFFVTNDRGVAIGTLSAWYVRDLHGHDWGRVHWVAMRPAYQGKGIMKAAMTHAMNALAQWHDRARLDTSTQRLPAIRMYLDFGFTPDLTRDGATAAWRQVATRLDHPALKSLQL